MIKTPTTITDTTRARLMLDALRLTVNSTTVCTLYEVVDARTGAIPYAERWKVFEMQSASDPFSVGVRAEIGCGETELAALENAIGNVEREYRWTVLYPEPATIDDARAYVKSQLDDGVRCPCCDKFVRRYSRPFNRSMGRAFLWLAHTYTDREDRGWVDVPKLAPRWLVS